MIIFFMLLVASLAFAPLDVNAGGYSWTDEKGVTHFSDEKPDSERALEREESIPAQFREDSVRSYERQYAEICGNISGLTNASVTLLDIYIERLASLQREIGTDTALTQETRTMLLRRLDTCAPGLLSARETAQQRENYQKKTHEVIQQKMKRFDKLKVLVSERLEQRRESSMAKGSEGARFYSDLRIMGDNPLSYGMTEHDVSRLWGEPMGSQVVNTRAGQMDRKSYPLGIDLYFKDGLLETWGWRR